MLLHNLCYRKKLIIPQHSGGGADGSIMIFKGTELNYTANTGVNGIVRALENILSLYRSKNAGVDVSAGDMCVLVHSLAMQFWFASSCSIQLAAAVGISNCPGAPRLQFLLGRPNATMAAEDHMLPSPFASADVILSRFHRESAPALATGN